MSREVVENTDGLLELRVTGVSATGCFGIPMRHFDEPLPEALHEAAEVSLVARAVELKVASILDALRDGAVDAEATLLSSLHRLLPQRHCEAAPPVVPGFLLVHVGVEGGLIKVDHRPVLHDPVRQSHGKLNALCLKPHRVLAVRVEFGVRRRLLDTVAAVEVPERVHGEAAAIELVDLLCSLPNSEVHPVGEAGATQEVLLYFGGANDLPRPSRALVANDEVIKVRGVLAFEAVDQLRQRGSLHAELLAELGVRNLPLAGEVGE